MKSLLSLPLLFVLALPGLSSVKSWDGGAGTANWADANNWNANGVPASGDQIYLSTVVPQINVPSVANCGVFGVDGPVAASLLATADLSPVVLNLYGITGKPLMYVGPGSPTTLTINNIVLRLQTSGEWYIETGKSLIIRNGYVTQNGQRSLTKTGGGTLLLDGPNDYTAQTDITGGTLALGASGRLDRTAWVAVYSGATLDVTDLAVGFVLGNANILAGAGTVNGKVVAGSGSTIYPGGGSVTGVLTVSNGFALAAGAHLSLKLNGAASYDSLTVIGGTVTLAGDLSGTTLGYAPAIGDTFYILCNQGSGTTTGTLSGIGEGGKIDIGGKWFRVSYTSDISGAGFMVGGGGNDVALQRIDDPTPTGVAAGISGATDTVQVAIQLTWQDNASNEAGYRVWRVLADGSLRLLTTLPADSTAFSETVPNYMSYTYAVQATGPNGPYGDLVYASPIQAGSSLAERKKQMIDYLAAEVPNFTLVVTPPHRVGRIAFWDGEARLLRGDTATGLSYITAALEDADPSGVDNPGFSMWPGMDAWFRWNHLFPQSLKDRYKAIYTFCPHYNTGATPNQRFMLCVAAYLAYGVWGNDMFLNSGAYYGTSDPTGKAAILNVLNTNPWKNFEEHDSNHYLQYSLAPMETLALYAPDAEVRNKARMVVNWGLAEAAGYWHNGHWCVSSTRGGTNTQQNDYDQTPWTWRMLFGGPTPYNSSFADSHATLPFAAPEFPGMLPELETVGRDRTQSYTRRSFAQRSAGVQIGYFKQAWMTPKYSLWSQAEGTVGGYNADGSIILSDMNTVAIQDGYQGQRWGLAWDSPPGEDSVLTITTPTTYSGTTSGISIFEDTLQKEDTMIAVYDIPAFNTNTGNNGSSPNQYLSGHIPAGYQAITNEAATTGRIFLHYNSVLVSIYLSNPFTWSTNFTTSCVKAGLAIETAPVSEYPQATAAERLAAFRAAVLANAPDASSINTSFPRLLYTNRHGNVLDLTYGYAGKINGVSVDYQGWPMLEDPWMYQSQRGHLHIFGRDRTVVSNYYNWTTTINNRPTTNPAPPVAVSGIANVDLTTLVGDTETPDSQLHFSVENPANGTVELLPDGHTARFTPVANFTGNATFEVTATDRGIHPQLVWHYDYEAPADPATGSIPDAAGTDRAAAVQTSGSGSATADTAPPAALGENSRQAIRLDRARLARTVTSSTLEMSNGSWTFATWFKRAANTSDDFILYLGSGDGFGGSGDELHLYCPAGSDTLRLAHYHTNGTNDVLLTSPATATVGQWHHAAVTFEKTADYTGTLRLWLDGAPASETIVSQWYLAQNQPLIIGGHASTTSSVDRWFDGSLDDTALLCGALTSAEISRLASRSVATFGGLNMAEAFNLTVRAPAYTPLESWRQQYFGSTANTGTAADTFDADSDGIVNFLEFALGSIPTSAASAVRPTLATAANHLTLTFFRARADVDYQVEGGSDFFNWTTITTNPGIVGQFVTVTDTVDFSAANPPSRFLRLKVNNP